MSTREINAGLAGLRAGESRATTRWAALPVLLVGTFMIVLDFFIVNVAMPTMQVDLQASNSAIEWVVAGYGLTFAVLLITAGRLGDLYGRRRLFAIGLALFTAASLECGIAWSADSLVVARLLQGVGAALLSPQVLSTMSVIYDGEDRFRAMSVYGVALGLAAVGGQLIGGVLISADLFGLGWRDCFLINVPVGVAALALLRRTVPASKAADAARLDVAGTVLATIALTALVLPLVEGRQHGWPAWTWAAFAGAAIALALFVRHVRRLAREGGSPLIDPALLADRSVGAGLVTQLFFWCGQASFFLVFALYLQPGRGLGALSAGGVFTIVAVAYLVASAKAPALTARLGGRLVTAGGSALVAGHALLALAVWRVGTGGTIAALAPGLLLIGTGMGLCIPPLTTTVMTIAGRRPELAGAASGALNTIQQVGNALGVAVVGVVFFGALDGGYAHAFALSLAALAGGATVVTVLSRVMLAPGSVRSR